MCKNSVYKMFEIIKDSSVRLIILCKPLLGFIICVVLVTGAFGLCFIEKSRNLFMRILFLFFFFCFFIPTAIDCAKYENNAEIFTTLFGVLCVQFKGSNRCATGITQLKFYKKERNSNTWDWFLRMNLQLIWFFTGNKGWCDFCDIL